MGLLINEAKGDGVKISMYLYLFIFITTILLNGCANHYYHLEGSAPYNEYIEKKIPLQRSAYLLSGSELWDSDRVTEYDKKKAVLVPEGTLVILNEVELNIGFDSIHSYTAFGRIYLDGHDKPVKFEYLWGWYDTIKRAPWESMTIPTKRYVGPNGLLYI